MQNTQSNIQSIEQFDQIMSEAVRAHQSGHLQQAMQRYEQAIEFLPSDPQIRYLLGMVYGQLGNFEAARQQLEKAVTTEPENPEYLNHFGLALTECGDHEAAIQVLEKSIGINPGDIGAQNNLGLSLKRLGEYSKARQVLEAVLEKVPDNLDVLLNLADLYSGTELVKAIGFYRRVLAQDSVNIKAATGLVALLPLRTHYQNLYKIIDYQLNQRPNDYEVLKSLGRLEALQENNLRAIEIFTDLLKMRPDDIQVLHLRSSAYREIGENARAKEDIDRVIQLKPGDMESLVAMGALYDSGQADSQDPLIDDLEGLIQEKNISQERKIPLYFSAANVYEQSGDLEKAFSCYEQGNAQVRKLIDYDARETEEVVADSIEYYESTPNPIQLPVDENNQTRPVFIVGMPRSGTSLTEQILDSHSQVRGLGELKTLQHYFSKYIRKDARHFNKGLRQASYEDYEQFRDSYRRESFIEADNVLYQSDKMPANFLYVGAINSLFPDSPIILCRRNPQDICLSIYKLNFKTKMRYAYSQREIAHYYNQFKKLTDYWLERFPGRIHVVQYEELVSHPEANIRKLLDYCRLEWEDQCLEFHQSRRPVKTASRGQVQQKMYTTSVDKWKTAAPYIQEMLDALEA